MKTKVILKVVGLVVGALLTGCGVVDGVTVNGRYADYEFRFAKDKTDEDPVTLGDK